MSTATKTKHIVRNTSRIIELSGMKQEALAAAIRINQQSVSKNEGSGIVNEAKLNAIELYERVVQTEKKSRIFGEIIRRKQTPL
jgi:hypothetical protein